MASTTTQGYVDLYLLPVRAQTIDAYRDYATAFGEIVVEHGGLRYREFRGDDLGDRFPVGEDELMTAAIVEFTSRGHRDEVMEKVMSDARVEAFTGGDDLADMSKMRYGGFETFVSA